jgi:threonine/homoserine/homoserine lactone efflux protein
VLLILLIKGFLVGLLASVPLGPAGVLCIQRTLNRGRLAGFFSGIGVALADTLFSVVAVGSLLAVQSWVEGRELWLQLLVGVVVVAVGIKIMLTNPIKQFRARGKQRQGSLGGALVSLFLLTINPINLLPVLFLVGVFQVNADSTREASLVVLGVLLGALSWWFVLSTVVSHYRKFFKLRQMWWINKVSGALILLLGGIAFLSGLYGLMTAA